MVQPSGSDQSRVQTPFDKMQKKLVEYDLTLYRKRNNLFRYIEKVVPGEESDQNKTCINVTVHHREFVLFWENVNFGGFSYCLFNVNSGIGMGKALISSITLRNDFLYLFDHLETILLPFHAIFWTWNVEKKIYVDKVLNKILSSFDFAENCSSIDSFFLRQLKPMLQGYILVAPDNNAVRELVNLVSISSILFQWKVETFSFAFENFEAQGWDFSHSRITAIIIITMFFFTAKRTSPSVCLCPRSAVWLPRNGPWFAIGSAEQSIEQGRWGKSIFFDYECSFQCYFVTFFLIFILHHNSVFFQCQIYCFLLQNILLYLNGSHPLPPIISPFLKPLKFFLEHAFEGIDDPYSLGNLTGSAVGKVDQFLDVRFKEKIHVFCKSKKYFYEIFLDFFSARTGLFAKVFSRFITQMCSANEYLLSLTFGSISTFQWYHLFVSSACWLTVSESCRMPRSWKRLQSVCSNSASTFPDSSSISPIRQANISQRIPPIRSDMSPAWLIVSSHFSFPSY